MVIKVWVQLLRGGENIGSTDQIKLEDDDSNVADLRKAVKVEFEADLNGISAARLNVSTARESTEYLSPAQKLQQLTARTEVDKPLFVHAPALAGGSEQVDVHRLLMRLQNSRDFPGVRQEVYRILAQSGAYYPINRGDGVRYDGRTLCIQAFTRNSSDASKAAGAISVVIQQRVSMFPGQIAIEQHVVQPSEAANTSLESIMATDYLPDASEECSPQETQSDSGVSAPDEQLNQFQSIEKGPSRFRVKAHLISKERLKQKPLSILNKNPNNFLALSASMHDFFDGRNVPGAEGIAIRYEGVTQDHPPKVTLRVIPVDDEIAQDLASKLRDFKATTDPPRGYLVNVHVTDPLLFQVCITWKYNKTVKAWADRGYAPQGAARVAENNFGLIAERFGGDHDLDEE